MESRGARGGAEVRGAGVQPGVCNVAALAARHGFAWSPLLGGPSMVAGSLSCCWAPCFIGICNATLYRFDIVSTCVTERRINLALATGRGAKAAYYWNGKEINCQYLCLILIDNCNVLWFAFDLI
jgi:hypothetical protein